MSSLLTFGQSMRAAASKFGERYAVYDSGRSFTYGQLLERCQKVASGVRRELNRTKGLAAIIADNCLEYFEIAIGAPEVGKGLVTLSSKLTAHEITAIQKDANVTLFFADSAGASRLAQADLLGDTRVITFGDEYERWLAEVSIDDIGMVATGNDIWTIPYTSGTTGKPKGVMLSQAGRVSLCLASAIEYGCFREDGFFLAVPPMCYGGGLLFPLAAIILGCPVEVPPKLDADGLIACFNRRQYSGCFLVPTQLGRICDTLDHTTTRLHSPPNVIISSAEPLSAKVRSQVEIHFQGSRIFNVYASTEGGIVSNCNLGHSKAPTDSVGIPAPLVEVLIEDPDGMACGPGQIGTLKSRSAFNFMGYLGQIDETAKVLRDGWVTVGDLALRDQNGFISIVGRSKNMIISGGINVYPREVEDALEKHPSVKEAAVFGLEDENWGESVSAVVVLAANAEFDPNQLVLHCRSLLSPHKVPKHISVAPDLPRNANGKVMTLELKKYAQKA